MPIVLDRITDIVVSAGGAKRRKVFSHSALDQDLGIYGDAADDLVVALRDEFGGWILEWPWDRFVNFNEDAFGRLVAAIWRFFHFSNVEMALPGTVSERLEIRHISAVIESGQWFEP